MKEASPTEITVWIRDLAPGSGYVITIYSPVYFSRASSIQFFPPKKQLEYLAFSRRSAQYGFSFKIMKFPENCGMSLFFNFDIVPMSATFCKIIEEVMDILCIFQRTNILVGTDVVKNSAGYAPTTRLRGISLYSANKWQISTPNKNKNTRNKVAVFSRSVEEKKFAFYTRKINKFLNEKCLESWEVPYRKSIVLPIYKQEK